MTINPITHTTSFGEEIDFTLSLEEQRYTELAHSAQQLIIEVSHNDDDAEVLVVVNEEGYYLNSFCTDHDDNGGVSLLCEWLEQVGLARGEEDLDAFIMGVLVTHDSLDRFDTLEEAEEEAVCWYQWYKG